MSPELIEVVVLADIYVDEEAFAVELVLSEESLDGAPLQSTTCSYRVTTEVHDDGEPRSQAIMAMELYAEGTDWSAVIDHHHQQNCDVHDECDPLTMVDGIGDEAFKTIWEDRVGSGYRGPGRAVLAGDVSFVVGIIPALQRDLDLLALGVVMMLDA